MRRPPMNKARFVKPEQLCIGDTIRVTWKETDVERSVVGKLAHREHMMRSTLFTTKDGVTLFIRYGSTENAVAVGSEAIATITLLDREPDTSDMLELDLGL